MDRNVFNWFVMVCSDFVVACGGLQYFSAPPEGRTCALVHEVGSDGISLSSYKTHPTLILLGSSKEQQKHF